MAAQAERGATMTMVKRLKLSLAMAVCGATALAVAAPAQAAVVVDQQSLVTRTPPNTALVLGRVGIVTLQNGTVVRNTYVQTITAGQRGLLDRIDLQIGQGSGPGLLGIGLFDGAWTPLNQTAPLVFNGIFSPFLPSPTAAVDAQQFFTFSAQGAGYRVRPGQVFSLVFAHQPFQPTGSVSLVVGTGTPFVPGQTPSFNLNRYAGGQLDLYVDNETTPRNVALPASVGFRTFVDTAGAVPEPGTWALMILGFGVVGAGLRRKIRVQAAHPA
jgi:hypothetical protein